MNDSLLQGHNGHIENNNNQPNNNQHQPNNQPTNHTGTRARSVVLGVTSQQLKRAVLSTVASIALLAIYPSFWHNAKADAPGDVSLNYSQPIKKELHEQLAPENMVAPEKNHTTAPKFGEFYIRPSGGLIFGTSGLGWGAGAYVGYQFLNRGPNYKNGKVETDNTSKSGWQIELGAAYQEIKNNRADRSNDENFLFHVINNNGDTLDGIKGKYPNFLSLLPNPNDPEPFAYTFKGITDTGSRTSIFFARNAYQLGAIKFDGLPTKPEDESPLTYVVHNGKFTLARSDDPSRTPIDLESLTGELLRGAFDGFTKAHITLQSTTKQQLVPITVAVGYRFALDNNHGFYFTPRLGAGALFNNVNSEATLVQYYQYNYSLHDVRERAQQWTGLLTFNTNLDYQVTPYLAISLGAGVNYIPTGYITRAGFEKFRPQIDQALKDGGRVESSTAEAFVNSIVDARDLSPVLGEKRSYVYGNLDLALQFSF